MDVTFYLEHKRTWSRSRGGHRILISSVGRAYVRCYAYDMPLTLHAITHANDSPPIWT